MPRHVIISSKIAKTSLVLVKQGYSEIEAVVDDYDAKMYLLINTKKKTFYFIDEEALKHAILIIENAYNKKPKILTLKDVKEWES